MLKLSVFCQKTQRSLRHSNKWQHLCIIISTTSPTVLKSDRHWLVHLSFSWNWNFY